MKKGVILAGGKGTRLSPLTAVLNKHLLPIYNKPMIYYPISLLISLGVNEILLTTHEKEMPLFKDLLGDGSKFGITITYKIQKEAGGIAEVLLLCDDFIKEGERFAMCLGDNIFYIPNVVKNLKHLLDLKEGAGVVLCEVKDPERFGVAQVDGSGKVISVEEKPKNPKSNFAITGLYFYDRMAVDFAKNIVRSARGELEITDVNNEYLKLKKLSSSLLEGNSVWLDTGTCDSMLEASLFVQEMEGKNNKLVGSVEQVALELGLITKEQLKHNLKVKSEYEKLLFELCK